jgi:putative transcriptional regulator
MVSPLAGVLLIADPFLKDIHFSRTVIVLTDYQPGGTIGFVLNKYFDKKVHQVINEIEITDIPLYFGGPVQTSTIHFLHQYPNEISGGVEILPGVYWGGDFKKVIFLLNNHLIDKRNIKIFVGYSGWGEMQLHNEIEAKTWLTVEANKKLLFNTPIHLIWKHSLQHLGGQFATYINYPIDPQLN